MTAEDDRHQIGTLESGQIAGPRVVDDVARAGEVVLGQQEHIGIRIDERVDVLALNDIGDALVALLLAPRERLGVLAAQVAGREQLGQAAQVLGVEPCGARLVLDRSWRTATATGDAQLCGLEEKRRSGGSLTDFVAGKGEISTGKICLKF